MQLAQPISNLLEQLQYIIDELSPIQYTQPIKLLSQSSIGQHTRHILEFFIELSKGYETGMVDYDKRVRDKSIEADKDFAIATIRRIGTSIQKPDKELLLQAEYGDGEAHSTQVFSNYYRELVYNLEHTVHHMALIRIGVNAVSNVVIPDEFGVAASTLKYRKACAR
ncbi:DinB family protein [Mucilaginibacter endophyticus]|uniref:DinB family protein n=1 Tax=Mucilaginibacter endophyticus TaxID=2675003 RepID=UPI000E0DECD6|nr:DinB family protein [Mucilaginibacter endophyticus]